MMNSMFVFGWLLIVVGAVYLFGRKPVQLKREIAHKDNRRLFRTASFIIKGVEVGYRSPSLDWDGSEETREESMEDAYIITAEYGIKDDISTVKLWVGDGVEVILQADILLSTLEDE